MFGRNRHLKRLRDPVPVWSEGGGDGYLPTWPVILEWTGLAATSGIIGAVAHGMLMERIDALRKFFSRRRSEEAQRPYVFEVAQLAVAAQLSTPVGLTITKCDRLESYWYVVIEAGSDTYRVQIPLDDPSDRTISIDVT